MLRIVAIGGPHGSGKSSVAKRLAEELEMNYISAGDVFRQIARERNLTLEEMSNKVLMEPKLDQQIDDRTKKLGSKENTVVDAQLAAYFTPKNAILKMSINASFETRCKRIAARDNHTLQEATSETKTREKSERKRFLDLYNIDINDDTVYDIIINSDRMSEEETYQMAKSIVLRSFDIFTR